MNDDLTPYAGTSGWRGSSTSRERAVQDDRRGITQDRHEKLMLVFSGARYEGLTWFEISDATGWHHGVVSGALTRAHKIGALMRLTEERGRAKGKRSKVYVLPQFVASRECEPYRPSSATKLARDVREMLLEDDLEGALEYVENFLEAPKVLPAKKRWIIRQPPVTSPDGDD